MYETMRGNGRDDFEVIVIMNSPDQETAERHYAEVPWATIRFDAPSTTEKDGGVLDMHSDLINKFITEPSGIAYFPKLITVGPEGDVISYGATENVDRDPTGAGFPWRGGKDGEAEAEAPVPGKVAHMPMSWLGPTLVWASRPATAEPEETEEEVLAREKAENDRNIAIAGEKEAEVGRVEGHGLRCTV